MRLFEIIGAEHALERDPKGAKEWREGRDEPVLDEEWNLSLRRTDVPCLESPK